MSELAIDLTIPLDRFTLAVRWQARADFLGIFGPSGAGKTTVLEAIAGLRRDVVGLVRFADRTCLDSGAGVNLPPEERGMGYVPQDGLLFPHRDVLGNILAGRRRGMSTSGPTLDPARVLRVLELSGLERRAVATLSGGERQRVALARALCSAPRLLLLDEPLAGLDLPLRRRILPFLIRVREEFALPTVLVSHDPTEIRILCDDILVLSEGRTLASGSPDRIFADPRVFPMAREEGFENSLTGRVAGMEDGMTHVELSPACRLSLRGEGLELGRRVVVGLRAEDLILALEPPRGLSAQNVLPGVVREVVEPSPDQETVSAVPVIIDLAGTGQMVLASISHRSRRDMGVRPGLPIHLVFKAQACRVLAAP
jgi:molybdate transport system ATP-binding protein